MRKLTVKNFSVIKDAELEFGKITVLIGPQSSGKSLLCKLAYFFSQTVSLVTTNSLLLRMSYSKFHEILQKEFLDRFPAKAWAGDVFSLEYISEPYSVLVQNAVSGSNPIFTLDPAFANAYSHWVETHLEEGSASGIISSVTTVRLTTISPSATN